MDKKKVFEILGIDSTKDAGIIKKAYRGKLVQVNPEDDPEGFKLLREAYEEAMRLIDVDEKTELKDTPVTSWLKRVEYIYSRLSSRINADCWRELFNEEVCNDFDTGSEAREAFLRFLMEHFRLSAEIWQLIEDTFQFADSKEELYEKFPEDFVDFIVQDAERKGWIDYTLFEGDMCADVDEFIELYLSLRRMNDSGQYDGAEEVIEKLKGINIGHPYLEAEKIRFLLESKRLKEAKEIAGNLRLKNVQDLYTRYHIAEVYLKSKELEKAYEECTAILSEDPDYFGAKVLLCAYYLEKGEYEEAKERCLDLLEIDNYNETLRGVMQSSNEGLIKSMKEQLDREPHNKALQLELAWCYYQNRSIEECMSLIGNFEIDDEIYYDYYNLMSRIYMEKEEYKEGLAYVEKWLAEILKTKDDGTKEARKRLKRLGLAYYYMSRCCYYFSMETEDKKEGLNECIKYIDMAVKMEKNKRDMLMYMSSKAQVFLNMEKYKHCIDVCDEIIRVDKGYYPAYLLRQEAYFMLKMGREVIEDYYNAIEIYDGNTAPYLLAVRVYQDYNYFEDAKQVINRAKEAGVESKELLFLELKNKRLMASTNEERKKSADELEKLFAAAQSDPRDLREISDLLHEHALCYYDMEDYETALKIIDKKLGLNRNYEGVELKGDILYHQRKYRDVIALYEKVLEESPEDANAYFRIGLCYSAMGRERDGINALGMERKAIEYYLKAAEKKPDHLSVNNELMEVYKKWYLENYRQEDYKMAVEYAKRQVEVNPNCYYYTDLGLVYLEGYELEEAIRAFGEAIKCDDGNPYPYNNTGYAYKIMGDFDKAYQYYRFSIERIDNEDSLPNWNMAVCYRSTGEFEKAIEIYEMLQAKGNNPILANKKLLETYKQMGEWEKVLKQARKVFELDKDSEMDYLLESGDAYAFAGNKEEALSLYKLAIKRFSLHSKPYIKMGNFMLWMTGEKKKALKYYKKAHKIARQYEIESMEEALQNIVITLKQLGKQKKGVRYVEELYNLQKRRCGSIEASLNNMELRKLALYNIAVWNYNTERYEEAKHYMSLMKESMNCGQCTYCTCYEYLELEGTMLELQGDYEEAVEKYQRALEIAPDNMHYIYKIRELKERTEVR